MKQIIKISEVLVKYDGNEETGSISSDETLFVISTENGLRGAME